jgi:hypothetical protein
LSILELVRWGIEGEKWTGRPGRWNRGRILTASEFQSLADVPPEVEWFANIENANTRRAYRNDVSESMAFAGIGGAQEFRFVKRSPCHRLAVLQGMVEVFMLEGHAKAKRAYGWSDGENENARYTAVLEIPPFTSPNTAVRASIVAAQSKS